MSGDDANRQITAALAAPFLPTEVKWKPQSVKGSRALAIAYIDARVVQERLDEVFGVDGWQDEYQVQQDGSVVCRLSCRFGDTWLTKMDVGGMSEQPDGGDRLKAAFSDALKRAAVKFGVGRYLYRLPHQWADYDPQRKQFTRPPELPAFARPGPKQLDVAQTEAFARHCLALRDVRTPAELDAAVAGVVADADLLGDPSRRVLRALVGQAKAALKANPPPALPAAQPQETRT